MAKIILQKRPTFHKRLNALKPGDRLPTGHVIDEVVDRGGAGLVYRAHKPTNLTPLYKAIKVIAPTSQMGGQAHLAKVLESEASITGLVGSNPYVVGVEDYGELADGSKYLVFPFIKGISMDRFLSQHIDRGSLLPFELVAFVLHRVTSVLTQTHSEGIAHRDLSPGNVMIQRSSGIPLILDWGNASEVYDGEVVGKPNYVAPEILKSGVGFTRENGFAADIFSLGMIARELITGHAPLQADDFEYRRTFDTDRLVPLDQVCADVPHELSCIIAACTTEDPTKRPTAEELYDTLGQDYLYTSGFGITAETMRAYLTFLEADPDLLDGEIEATDSFTRNLIKLAESKSKFSTESQHAPYKYSDVTRTFRDAFGHRNYNHCLRLPFVNYVHSELQPKFEKANSAEEQAAIAAEFDRATLQFKEMPDANLERDIRKHLAKEFQVKGTALDLEFHSYMYGIIKTEVKQIAG